MTGTVQISPLDRSQLDGLDHAAQDIMRRFHPELLLVIREPHVVCIPGGEGNLADTAKVLRQIADALDKTHSEVGGLTLAQLNYMKNGGQA